MQMVSPEHCVVDLVYEHPVLGSLDVDRFQRTRIACETIRNESKIVWQGITLKVARVSLLDSEGSTPHYFVTLKDPVATTEEKL